MIHLDVDESSAERVKAILQEHASASTKETGNLVFEVLQRVGRPNHFAILQVWIDQESRDAHAQADQTVAFRNDLQPYLYNRYQEQAHVALNTADPTALDSIKDAQLFVLTHVETTPGVPAKRGPGSGSPSHGETVVHQLVTASRTHPGNLRCDALRSADQPDHMMLLEAWATPEHQKAHAETADVRQFDDAMSSMTTRGGAAARALLANTSLTTGVCDQQIYRRID